MTVLTEQKKPPFKLKHTFPTYYLSCFKLCARDLIPLVDSLVIWKYIKNVSLSLYNYFIDIMFLTLKVFLRIFTTHSIDGNR